MWYESCWLGIALTMSIDLPRSAKALHFSGSVRACAPPAASSSALGQLRPEREPAPAPSRGAPRSRDHDALTPRPGRLTTLRGRIASLDDDDAQTLALRRSPSPRMHQPTPERAIAVRPKPAVAGIPSFRSADDLRVGQDARTVIVRRPSARAGLPLAVWLVAALLAGIASYHVTPGAVDGVAHAVRALDRR